MKHSNKPRAWIGLPLILLCLGACDSNGIDYPDEYIGFAKITESYTFSKQAAEQDISIKIIAATKSEREREVTLSGKWKPGTEPVFKLLDQQVTLPAKKKSATARIRIYPKLLKQKQEIRLICSPRDNDAKQSQLILKLDTR